MLASTTFSKLSSFTLNCSISASVIRMRPASPLGHPPASESWAPSKYDPVAQLHGQPHRHDDSQHSFMTAHILIPSPCDEAGRGIQAAESRPQNLSRLPPLSSSPAASLPVNSGVCGRHLWLPGVWMLAKRRPVSLGPCDGWTTNLMQGTGRTTSIQRCGCHGVPHPVGASCGLS